MVRRVSEQFFRIASPHEQMPPGLAFTARETETDALLQLGFIQLPGHVTLLSNVWVDVMNARAVGVFTGSRTDPRQVSLLQARFESPHESGWVDPIRAKGCMTLLATPVAFEAYESVGDALASAVVGVATLMARIDGSGVSTWHAAGPSSL